MPKNKVQYKCSSCGNIVSKWMGQCSACKEWNTLEEYIAPTNAIVNKKAPNISNSKPLQMKQVTINQNNRIFTGIDEFDRVVGGGLVDDSITILAAPPGTGKSTLCISLCDQMVKLGKTVVYASGEESASQLKARAERLNLSNSDDIYVSESSRMDDVINLIIDIDADFIVVDSIQTFTLDEYLPSRAGNPTQVLECASALQELAKRSNKPRMIIIIGQMNKDDELVGVRALEHLVDTVLILDGNSDDTFRMLFANKNRFGDTGEIGFFQMTDKGLLSVANPSEYFLTERQNPVMGTALTVLKEGSRPIVIEIESLVTRSFTSYPTRISEAISKDRLNVLISILEQHCKMNFFDKNVVINTQNNIKLRSSDVNLATLMTIASSYYQKPLPLNSVFLADVGLTGELKKIPNIEMRLKELDRMGYDCVYVSKNTTLPNVTFKNIKIKQFNLISEVLKDLGLTK
jgi:DNA repair protein RadA/Sms